MTNVYLKLKLPFCLYIEDGLYKLNVPEISAREQVFIYLTKFRRPKEKIDYMTFWRAELVERGELWNDPNGTFRRTATTVILPRDFLPQLADPNTRKYHDDFQKIFDVAVLALNRLIEVYRYITEDTYIPFIQVSDVYNTFEIGNCIISSIDSIQYFGRSGGFDNRLTNTRPDYDEDTHQQIEFWLSSGELIPLHEQIMMNAHFQLQNRNWRTAIIEVQTAFEVFINHTIRNHYLKIGCNNSKVDKIMECGLANLIKDHLPKATGRSFIQGITQYDSWYKDTYKMRNDVIHNGYLPTEQEALQAVLGVEKALTYIINREEKKYWTKKQPSTVVNEFIVVPED